jgi:shikimate kinase
MKSSIALIGFMGTGKSTVGRLLAEMTGREFVELDDIIAGEAGMSIPAIFEHEGEIGFREREISAVKKLAGKRNTVIACGGGVVLNMINIERLRQECIIICLTASPLVILERTRQQPGDRPLLDVDDEYESIKKLLHFRRPFYRRAADIIIDTSGLTPENVARRIVRKLKL